MIMAPWNIHATNAVYRLHAGKGSDKTSFLPIIRRMISKNTHELDAFKQVD
jgi:hypothetical protein